MSMYLEGYSKAREAVLAMDEMGLLDQIDALWGRANLPEDYSVEDLRHEALKQVQRDFTDTSSKTYETVEFYTRLHKAMKAQP